MISKFDSGLNCLIFDAPPYLWDAVSYQHERSRGEAIVFLPKAPSKHMWVKCEMRTDKEQ